MSGGRALDGSVLGGAVVGVVVAVALVRGERRKDVAGPGALATGEKTWIPVNPNTKS